MYIYIYIIYIYTYIYIYIYLLWKSLSFRIKDWLRKSFFLMKTWKWNQMPVFTINFAFTLLKFPFFPWAKQLGETLKIYFPITVKNRKTMEEIKWCWT